ncbi:MAG: Na/Pi cotransporter family protein [Lachnospira eligens]|uniref:Na/Pi cotransporter family protein n=1 Tax=Lachnospira eligens TaxID=39485 RepID=UPI000A86D23C|nr:Na/Pi cotransporter family protein [Lachnospira eligens]MCO7142084.1 Na/Pi cotransporter family protein [Lachnospira eligens]HRN09638.1 Na/Pi cotransporter family protein [Lachnospira eligens]
MSFELIHIVIILLGGIALFLFGMQLMGDGLKKVAGGKLEVILYRLSNTPLKGVLLGTGVTAIIQSSSATSVMVVGFVNAGMIKMKQAIGIIMGAIIGTSVTGWVLCLSDISGGAGWVDLLSTEVLAAIIGVIGIMFRMICKNPTKKHIGDIMIGFCILMVGMQNMSAAVAPLRSEPAFIDMLTKFSNPFIGILIGLLVTAVLQSASATVGILQALSVTGAISFSVALPIIMGIAVGAAMPVIISSFGATTDGKRTAFVYLLVDALGALIWAVVFYSVNHFVHFSFMDRTMTTVSIAFVNSLFRVATVAVLFPFIRFLEKMVCAIFKEVVDEEDKDIVEISVLDDRFIAHPTVAIEQAKTVLCSMAHMAQKNLIRSMELLDTFSQEKYDKIQRREDKVDRYEDKLGTYLVKITQQELTSGQNKEVSKLLHTISDFERISDHAVNISQAAAELFNEKLRFSDCAVEDVELMSLIMKEIVGNVIDAFEQNKVEYAYKTEPLEELVDIYCDEMKMNHVKRVQKGECTLHQGFIFNDLLTDFERIADHCSNVAVAIIELELNVFDTHEYLINLKKDNGTNFDKYFEEYKEMFPLSQY